MGNKLKLLIFGIFVLSTIMSFAYLLWEPEERVHWVSISGRVTPDKEALDIYQENKTDFLNKRDYLQISLTKFNPANSPQPIDDQLDISTIDWKTDIEGSYVLSYPLRAPMKVVVYVTCSNHSVIDLNTTEGNYSADVTWGLDCLPREETRTSINIEEELKFLDNRITYATSSKIRINPTTEESKSIDSDIEQANGLRGNANRDKETDYNGSIQSALQGHWFASRALYKIRISELRNCVDSEKEIFSKFYPLFFKPSYESKQSIKSSESSLTYHNQTNFIFSYPYGIDNKKLIDEIEYIDREEIRIQDVISDCKETLSLLNGTYIYQSESFNERLGFLIFLVVIAFLIGTFIEAQFKIITRFFISIKNDTITPIKNYFGDKIFSGKVVSMEKNIRWLLAGDGAGTALNAFIILSQKFNLLVFTSFISAIFFIIGLIFVVISLKFRNSEVIKVAWLSTLLGLVMLLLIPVGYVTLLITSSIGFDIYQKIFDIIPKSPTIS